MGHLLCFLALVQMAPIEEGGAASSSDVAVAEPLPNTAEAGRVSQEAVPIEQGQPLRAVEPDEWAMKVRTKPIWKRLQNDNETFTSSHTYLRFLGVQHACLEKPLMIRIGDGKTPDILDWTLLHLITLTLQQRSKSGAVAALEGPKGVTERMVRFDCETWGFGVCVFKCQNEPAEMALQNALVRTRQFKTIPRNTPQVFAWLFGSL